MSIEVRNTSKSFGAFRALSDVSLTVNSGELVALLGPSGSGKTTLLRIIGGLETPDPGGGPVLFHDEDVSDRSAAKRQVGFVFQHYALFRHMNVFENVAFGLRSRPRRLRRSRADIRQRVMELLKLVQLEGLAKRHPSQLSGGQRQRVALARALAVEPKVLLLDEPFGALDATVRRDLRRWLRRLHDDIGVTSLFVTHDQEEALEVADRIAVMNAGRIEQVATPQEVYEHPANPFVYKFLGNVNLFHGRLEGHGSNTAIRLGDLRVPAAPSVNGNGHAPAPPVVFARPHEVEVFRDDPGRGIPARVEHVGFAGSTVRVELRRLDVDQAVDAELPAGRGRELNLRPGEHVFLSLSGHRVFAEDFSI